MTQRLLGRLPFRRGYFGVGTRRHTRSDGDHSSASANLEASVVEVKCEDTFHGELEGARVQVSDARECESQLESIDALTVASSGDVSGDQGLARLDEWLQASQRVESRLAQIQEGRHAHAIDSKQRGVVRRIRRPSVIMMVFSRPMKKIRMRNGRLHIRSIRKLTSRRR